MIYERVSWTKGNRYTDQLSCEFELLPPTWKYVCDIVQKWLVTSKVQVIDGWRSHHGESALLPNQEILNPDQVASSLKIKKYSLNTAHMYIEIFGHPFWCNKRRRDFLCDWHVFSSLGSKFEVHFGSILTCDGVSHEFRCNLSSYYLHTHSYLLFEATSCSINPWNVWDVDCCAWYLWSSSVHQCHLFIGSNRFKTLETIGASLPADEAV